MVPRMFLDPFQVALCSLLRRAGQLEFDGPFFQDVRPDDDLDVSAARGDEAHAAH